MLKNANFWKKYVNITSTLWALPSNRRLPLVARDISSRCYFKNNITTVNVLLLLFLTFAPIFHFKLCSFLLKEGARMFLAPEHSVP